MKTFITAALLILIIGNIGAVDIESYQFIDYLRSVSAPGKIGVFEDGVVFTVSSSYRRVGISFAHEDYAEVHWFRHLLLPRDTAELYAEGKPRKNIDPNRDSGLMFHVETIPANLENMDYRLIIDGLWTFDPLNPLSVTGPSGITVSRFPLPEKSAAVAASPGTYRFSFRAPPGETVSVCGSFNNWDPFMYELRETEPGVYTLTLPLPPGNFEYVFYHRGEAVPDPDNAAKFYSREGRYVSGGEVR